MNEIDMISMYQCHIKLLFYVYTSTGFFCTSFKFLRIMNNELWVMDYVLVSYTTTSTFPLFLTSNLKIFALCWKLIEKKSGKRVTAIDSLSTAHSCGTMLTAKKILLQGKRDGHKKTLFISNWVDIR